MHLEQLDYQKALEIDEFWKKHWAHIYSLPDQSASIIDACAVSDIGKVVAYGQVKHFAEMQLFTDLSARPRDKSRAVKLLMQEAFRGVEQAGLKDIYCFIRDDHFASLIARRYGFGIMPDPGHMLLRQL